MVNYYDRVQWLRGVSVPFKFFVVIYKANFCRISLLGCYFGISVSKVLQLLKLCAIYNGFNFDRLVLDCCKRLISDLYRAGLPNTIEGQQTQEIEIQPKVQNITSQRSKTKNISIFWILSKPLNMYSLGKEFINGPSICLLYVYTSSTFFLFTFNIEMRNVILISY